MAVSVAEAQVAAAAKELKQATHSDDARFEILWALWNNLSGLEEWRMP